MNLLLSAVLSLGLVHPALAQRQSGFISSKTSAPTRSLSDAVLSVAAAQFAAGSGKTREAFLEQVRAQVKEANERGVELLVLPELLTWDLVSYGSDVSEKAQLKLIAEDFTPKYFSEIRKLSQETGMAILAGSSPRLEDERIFNTALLALPDGRSYQQDKLFLTPDEKKQGWSTGSELRLIDAPWGRTVILICYDSEFPAISQKLVRERPELLLIPSMTADPAGLRRVRWSAQARVVEHYAYAVVAGTVAEKHHLGQGVVLTPQDAGFPEVAEEGPLNQAGLVRAELDMAFLRKKRTSAGIYPARDQTERKAPIRIVE